MKKIRQILEAYVNSRKQVRADISSLTPLSEISYEQYMKYQRHPLYYYIEVFLIPPSIRKEIIKASNYSSISLGSFIGVRLRTLNFNTKKATVVVQTDTKEFTFPVSFYDLYVELPKGIKFSSDLY